MSKEPLLMPLPMQKSPGVVDKFGRAVVKKDKRPSSYELLVKQDAALAILPEIMAWLKRVGPTETHDEADVLNDIVDIACEYKDGYEFGKKLEDRHLWSVDSELVDILDSLSLFVSDAHQRLVKLWVNEFDIRPEFSLGDKVIIQAHRLDNTYGDVEGEIATIYADQAKYSVYCASLGHIRPDSGGSGTLGLFIPFESARLSSPEAALTPAA